MAGLGRRTHYRKHLTDSVLFDLPEPQENEAIAKVMATRGGNQFDICLANGNGKKLLALLPTKFHKLVWVKRNDYVIVETGGDDNQGDDSSSKNNDGVRYIISHILYKDQVNHLKSSGLWPKDDPEFAAGVADDTGENKGTTANDDGIVYGNGYDNDDGNYYYEDGDGYGNDDDLFVNTNRVARLEIQDSSSEDESSDGED